MPAGHIVTIDHDGARRRPRQYWDCRPDRATTLTERDLSEDDAVAELTRLLKQSIARRMVSDVPFGVLLSGGVDSSLNVALMSELMTRPVTTFTIGYEGKEDYNEFQFARAGQPALQHRPSRDADQPQKEAQDFLPLLVRLQDEPIADNVCIPLYFLSRLVKQTRHDRRPGRRRRRRELPRLLVVRALPAEIRSGLPAGAAVAVVVAALSRRRQGRRRPGVSGEDLEIQRARARRARNCSGAARSAGGARCATRLTPDRRAVPAADRLSGRRPAAGQSHARSTATRWCAHYLGGARPDICASPKCCRRSPTWR